MSKIYANWSINLYIDCPEYKEYFDLNEQDDDFRVNGRRAEIF